MGEAWRTRAVVLGLACGLLMVPLRVAARPGDIDPTFGIGGVASTNFTSFQSRVFDVTSLPDGRVVAAGFRHMGGTNDMALVRYLANGAIDPSFGNNGIATAAFRSGADYAEAVVRQSDGKLVVAGWTSAFGANRWGLARFTADGVLDPTFGANGLVDTQLQSGGCEAYALLQQADGKLVAAGRSSAGGGYRMALARYNTDGSLDATFGSGGIVVQLLNGRDGTAYAIAEQTDGKLIAAGIARGPAATAIDFAVVRFATDGSLDPTFGGGGVVTTAATSGSNDDGATSLLIQPDGKLVAAGYAATPSSVDLAVVRYQANGALDAAFGTAGIVVRDLSGIEDHVEAIVRQADGKLVATGYTASSSAVSSFAAARFTASGAIDPSFGGSGVVITDVVPGGLDRSAAATLLPDGRLLSAGFAYVAYEAMTAIRYTTSGVPDATFGTGGIVTTTAGGSDDFASALAHQSDGKWVAAGAVFSANAYRFALARYTADGAPDASFGSAGTVTTGIGGFNWLYGVIQQGDGKVVAVGHTYNGSNYELIALRYTTTGALDTSFNTTGYRRQVIGASTDAYAVLQQPDGKLVVAGETFIGSSNWGFTLVRLTTGGALDTTFGSGGIVTTNLGAGLSGPRALIRQADGKLVAAGWSSTGSDRDITLIRYLANGALDTSFGTAGIVRAPLGGTLERAQALVVQPDGKLVAAGYAGSSTDTDFALIRLDVSGNLDTSFGSGGVVRTSFGPGLDQAFALVLQADGKLVAAGHTTTSVDTDYALARYNPDGTLDAGFGNAGLVIAPLGDGADSAAALALQADGRLVAAGRMRDAGDLNFAVARFAGQVCGDGLPQSGEECDDGNRSPGDGCAADCTNEPTPSHTATPTASDTPSPSATASRTPTPMDTWTATATPTSTATSSATATTSSTPTEISSPTATASSSPTATTTVSPTLTHTATATRTATATVSFTATATGTASPSATATASGTPTRTALSSPCDTAPRPNCRGAEDNVFQLQTRGRGRLLWRWTHGAATTQDDFGDPRAGTGFALCLYARGALLQEVIVDADASAWKRIATRGFAYRAPTGSSGPIRRATLRGGDAGRAKILLRGSPLPLPSGALPLLEPADLIVQWVRRTTDRCWQSRYSGADVQRNSADLVKARSGS